MSRTKTSQKIHVTVNRTQFSKLVHEMSDTMTNKEIASHLNVSISRVAGVMAWKNNRASWMA